VLTFFIFYVVWFLVLWIIGIGKIVHNGFHNYFKELTNWTWSINAIFYLVAGISKFSLFYKVPTEHNIVSLYANGALFWIANGMSWIVFILIFVLLGDNPAILMDEAEKYGLGFVLDMNALFHWVPTLINVLYLFLEQRILGWSVSILTGRTTRRTSIITWIYFVFVVLIGGAIGAGVYFSCFDPSDVYGITTPLWVLIPTGLLVNIVFNALSFLTLRLLFVK
jgi:hypothetical protein